MGTIALIQVRGGSDLGHVRAEDWMWCLNTESEGIRGFGLSNEKCGVAMNCDGKAMSETDLDTKISSGDVKQSARSTR